MSIALIFKNYINKIIYNLWLYKKFKKYSVHNGLAIDVGCGANVAIRFVGMIGYDLYPRNKKITKSRSDNLPIDNAKVSFLFSSHCLEHSSNPLKVIHEWKRVLVDNGTLFLVLPDHMKTFDRFRKPTPYMHLVDDYNQSKNDDDTTHWDDFYHNVLTREENYRYVNIYSEHIRFDNPDFFLQNMLVHHHVFNVEIASTMLCELGFELLESGSVLGRDDSFFILAKNKCTNHMNQI